MCVCDSTDGADAGRHSSRATSDGGRSELERVMRALVDQRSRYVCYHVVENDPTDLSECAEEVASRELERPPEDIPEAERDRIETSLYHKDVPKLDDLGIVEYDERSGAIRCEHPPSCFEEFLCLARAVEQQERQRG